MKEDQFVKLPTSSIKLRIGAFVLLLVAAESVFAQRPSVRVDPTARERELSAREMDLRNAERPIKKPSTERERKQLFEQVKDSFGRIQVLNNDLMKAAMTEEHLNYKQISATADELQRRANKLRLMLALPPTQARKNDWKGSAQPDVKQLRLSIAELDRSIGSFVNNSLFRNTFVNDVQLAAKASNDLASIIEISRNVNQSAKNLSKQVISKPKP